MPLSARLNESRVPQWDQASKLVPDVFGHDDEWQEDVVFGVG